MISRVCQYCGKNFKTKTSEVRKGGGLYCSVKCYSLSRRRRTKRVCKICGKQFEVHNYIVGRGEGNYCSVQCRDDARKNHKKTNCLICGKIIKVQPNQERRGEGKYCSVECMGKGKLGKNTGVENYIWKGEKAGIAAKHQWVAKNKPKPKLCQICGKKRKLELSNNKNHIYIRRLKDYDWLCAKCHSKRDNRKAPPRDDKGRFVSIGLIGEMITGESRKKEYLIKEVLR